MTIHISTKNIFYAFLIITLCVSGSIGFSKIKANAENLKTTEENQNAAQESIDQMDKNNTDFLAEGFNPTLSGNNIPYVDCYHATLLAQPVSSTYKSSPYEASLSNQGASNLTTKDYLQDINGDGLPDYAYSRTQLIGSSPLRTYIYQGCVRLNNGNGWTQVHICYASTQFNETTGQIGTKQYRGDCAQEE